MKIILGDALERLKQVESETVDCCVTSPPYYGLRDYGTAEWQGGDKLCDHRGKLQTTRININQNTGRGNDNKNADCFYPVRAVCPKCGAVRIDKQLGLEQTPEEYIYRLVEVFREVRRTLKPDGTLWLVIGDCYAGSGKGAANYPENAAKWKQGTNKGIIGAKATTSIKTPGLKPKDLIGIPWMLAFALRADGWYLRSDIIWHKPNVMPESVKDRPTKSYEHVFLLAKSRRYYYDNDAVLVPANYDGRKDTLNKGASKYSKAVVPGSNPQSQHIAGNPHERWRFKDGMPVKNRRDIWKVSTKPYKAAHFATFPPELIEPCILAGSRPGGIVLDPFIGSGTTAEVALRLGRHCIGIDLNPDYAELIHKRIRNYEV